MPKPIYIEVPGNPIPKKRPRFARVGKGVKTYNPNAAEEAQFLDRVRNQVGEFRPFKGPISLALTFIMQRPKSHYGTGKNADKLKESAPKYHIIKPDRDNLEKFVMDALNGYLWRDDCQVVEGPVVKKYCGQGDEFGARTLIKVFGIKA